jgi:hypothetical protein
VAADWVHPKDGRGHDVPLYEWFGYDEDGIAEAVAEGRADPSKPYYGLPMMPRWKPEELSHVQYYEATSEGTPLSPAFPTVEELARWCFEHENDADSMLVGIGSLAGWERYLRAELERWEERRKLFELCEALGARAGR